MNPVGEVPSVSVVIATFNRREAVVPTVEALFRQDYPWDRLEVVVVDDGSRDGTAEVVAGLPGPFSLRVFSQENRGVSEARNRGAWEASGELLVFLSDDLLVPGDFIREHVRAHRAVTHAWVVGGFRQLSDTYRVPFGRFVNHLEDRFQAGRMGKEIAPGIREYFITARNLSLPREEFVDLGGFDTRFRTTCEDQDLFHRARSRGVRVVYNERIQALHNEQATTLHRYGMFQRKGARDTVRLLRKYPGVHDHAPVAAVNGPVNWRMDGLRGSLKKLLKRILSPDPPLALLRGVTRVMEWVGLPDRVLFRVYQAILSLYIFRGWREGLTSEELNQAWHRERSQTSKKASGPGGG